MIAAIENATIPVEHESIDSALSNEAKENLRTPRVVFFCGDEISSKDKYEMPTVKGFGGMYFPQIKTLVLDPASKGMLFRCKFQRLIPRMMCDSKGMLGPIEGAKWEAGFKQSNAVYKDGRWEDRVINGFMQSDQQASKEGRLELKKRDDIVYKERFPGEEIRFITQRATPYGAGGVVEITALRDASASEVREAQLFFFENWDSIIKGQATLPATIRELEALIRSKAIPTDWSGTKRNQYNQIKGEMLRSCSEYRQSMIDTLNKVEIAMKDSAAKGFSTAYPPSCEIALELLEQTRKDEIAAGNASGMDRLARAWESQNSPNDRALLLEERKMYVAELQAGLRERDEEEEIRLGIKKAAVLGTPDGTLVDGIGTITVPVQEGGWMTEDQINAAVAEVATRTYEVNGVESPMPTVEELALQQQQIQDEIMNGLPQKLGENIEPMVYTCGAEKANGEPCQREVPEFAGRCFQHEIKG